MVFSLLSGRSSFKSGFLCVCVLLFSLVTLMPAVSEASSCMYRTLQPLRQHVPAWPDQSFSFFNAHHQSKFDELFDALQQRSHKFSYTTSAPKVPAVVDQLQLQVKQQNYRLDTTKDAYTLQLFLPGNSAGTVSIDVQTGSSRGERKLKITSKWPKSNIAFFPQHVFTLAEDVALDSVEANFVNGILTVTAKRVAPQPPETRSIPIADREVKVDAALSSEPAVESCNTDTVDSSAVHFEYESNAPADEKVDPPSEGDSEGITIRFSDDEE
jgi:HSP20 family molecular chaperone IbpA